MTNSAIAIRDRLLNNITNPASKIEGSFTMDNIGAVSEELARILTMEIEPITDNVMLDTASGIMLDRKASEYAVTRKNATKAKGIIVFRGMAGVQVPEGFEVENTDGSLNAKTTVGGIITNTGSVEILSEINVLGNKGNVTAGVLTAIKRHLNGVESANNLEFKGGFDIEEDKDLRKRVFEKIRRPIISGNKNHYILWAKEVHGVKEAKVVPLWNGNGTVKIIILGENSEIPSDGTIDAVSANIGEKRPIGANVSVVKATPKLINIIMQISIKNGHDLNVIKNMITEKINNYIRSIAFDDSKLLSYYKIGDLIFNVDGVNDILSYTINNGNSSINQSFEEFFKLNEVIINV